MKKPRTIKPYAKDLFGEVPVTESELITWTLEHVPHISHNENRIRRYIKDWNVIDKVRRWKMLELK